MKKICIATILCIIMLIATACGETNTSVEPETTVESTIEATTEKETTEEVKEATPTDPYADIDMDDIALDIVKEACEARWEKNIETEDDFNYINEHNIYFNGQYYGEFHWLKELLNDYNQAEYDVLCKYTNDNFNDRNFKDEKLKEYMINYADAVEQQLEVGKHTDFALEDENDNYINYADKKGLALLDIMNNYDIKFDNKYISNVENIKNTASPTDAD